MQIAGRGGCEDEKITHRIASVFIGTWEIWKMKQITWLLISRRRKLVALHKIRLQTTDFERNSTEYGDWMRRHSVSLRRSKLRKQYCKEHLDIACWGWSLCSRLLTVTRCPAPPFLLSTCFLNTHQTHCLVRNRFWLIASKDGLAVYQRVLQQFQFLREADPAFVPLYLLSPKQPHTQNLLPHWERKRKWKDKVFIFKNIGNNIFLFSCIYKASECHWSFKSAAQWVA